MVTTGKCFYGCICKIYLNLKLLSYSIKSCVDEIICNFICNHIFCFKKGNKEKICCCFKSICCCCFCCECCCNECIRKIKCCNKCITKVDCCNKCFYKVEDKDYEANEGYFCYCYKSKRNLKWFDNFIKDETQFKFFPLLVEYFIIQINTIVFEIKFDENNDEGYYEFINVTNILIFIVILIGIFIGFFLLTFIFGILRICLSKCLNNKLINDEDKNKDLNNEQNNKKKCGIKCEELSNTILNGTIGIVITNSFYSLFVSLMCLSKDVEKNYFFYIPILMNKFYYFVFAYHCTVYTDNEEGIDYFSSATLLSIYLFIWDLFIDLLKKAPIEVLLYVQIALSSFIIVIFIFSLLILMFCFKCNNCCVQLIFDKFIKIKDEDTKIDNSKNNVECKEPLKLYITPPLIGLNNVGFINSTLQCLSQTEPLTNYFLKETTKKKIDKYIPLSIDIINSNNSNELQLSKEYYELIQNLWSKDKQKTSSFSPFKFMNIIEKMNPAFKLGQPGNYKDFIIFILNQIHKELKKPKELDNNINILGPLNIYDQKNVFDHFFNDFKKECSIISDIFFGITETTCICLNCQNINHSQGMETPISYNYLKFNCLIFPLEKVKNNSNSVTLNDCFKYNQKEFFTTCNVCQTNNLKYTSKIYICPSVLILILDRSKDNIFDIKLNFSETIDITQFVSIVPKNISEIIEHSFINSLK